MADYSEFAELLNTTDGMECIVNNVGHDDDVVSCAGVPWFKFNNVAAATMYASGNTFIGLGVNTEQLKVCRRDAKMWYLYRQEGTLYGVIKFFKLRWQGYAQYNSTTSTVALQYELFLFDDGRMFLNVIQTPTSSGYLGTSALVCGSNTYPLTIGTNENCPIYYTFTPTDETGTAWAVENAIIIIQPPFDRKWLVQQGETLYTVTDGALQAIDPTEPTAAVFQEFGVDDIPDGALLVPLENPTLLYWQDSEDEIPTFTGTVTGLPPLPQSIITNNVDMTDETILGIQSVEIVASDDILFAISFDDGETWKAHNGTAWVTITAENAGMTALQVQNISLADWAAVAVTGHYRIRFTLTTRESYVSDIIVKYIN